MRVRFSCLVLAMTLVMSFTSSGGAQNLPDRNQLANALRRAAQDNDSQKMLQLQRLIVESDEIRYGQNHPKFAEQLVRLGSLLRIADNYSEAETRFKRAIEIYERNRPPDILDLALAYREITQLYSQLLGRYADAEQILRRNQAMLEKAFGPRHQHTATALSDLGNLYYHQKRYADAEPFFERSLAIKERLVRPNDPALGTGFHNLANVYWKQGRLDDAERMFKRALALRRQARQLGHNGPYKHAAGIRDFLSGTASLSRGRRVVEPVSCIGRKLERPRQAHARCGGVLLYRRALSGRRQARPGGAIFRADKSRSRHCSAGRLYAGKRTSLCRQGPERFKQARRGGAILQTDVGGLRKAVWVRSFQRRRCPQRSRRSLYEAESCGGRAAAGAAIPWQAAA